jgi:putative sigma-54 modulation protein
MQVIIESPHIRLSEKLTGLVESRFQGIGKLYDRINHCNVVLHKEKNDMQKKFVVSANMNLPKAVLFGEDRAESFEAALDKVVHELEHQLQKHKQKLQEKR